MSVLPPSPTHGKSPSNWRPAEDRPPVQPSLGGNGRRALRSIVLNSAGQDVAKCSFCSRCERYLRPGMDLTFGQIIQAALRDDASAMTNRTLWACDDLLEGYTLCRSGIDLTSVMLALRNEAEVRGLRSEAESPACETAGAKREEGS